MCVYRSDDLYVVCETALNYNKHEGTPVVDAAAVVPTVGRVMRVGSCIGGGRENRTKTEITGTTTTAGAAEIPACFIHQIIPIR